MNIANNLSYVLIHIGYDREKIIMKFIQLNLKVQKKGDRFKSKF